MKTTNFLKTSVLMVALAAVFSSCSKIDDNKGLANYFQVGSGSTTTIQLGLIADSGYVKGAVRHMHTVFVDNGDLVDRKTGAITGTVSQVNIGFYTNEDGKIPTGQYIFSPDKSKEPFTFDSGFVYKVFNIDNGAGDYNEVTDGAIDVIFDGVYYTFTFNCDLDSGDKLSGTFYGKMDYYDAHQ